MLSKINFIDAYAWIVELLDSIINVGEALPIRKVKMLSSRFSAKSFSTEHFIVVLLLQQRRAIQLNFMRARNADSLASLETAVKLIDKYHTGIGVMVNRGTLTIKCGKNQLNFITLNEEKNKVEKTGGKIGVQISYGAEWIINFFEECSQLNKDLVQNLEQSFRGNLNTKTLTFYASNPWSKTHWFVDEFLSKIPENEDNIALLEEQGYLSYFDKADESLYFKPRYTINPHVPLDVIYEIEQLKDLNYKKWKIVSMGLSGSLRGNLYQESLKKLNQNISLKKTQNFYGGIDWADGKSGNASITAAHLIGIDEDDGIEVFAEYTRNNKRGMPMSTDDQIRNLVRFFINCYEKVQKPITIYLDSAALGDFWMLFQRTSERMGYDAQKLEFLPAFKPKNVWERVEFVSAAIAMGIIRFKEKTCPKLYEALDNCYEVIKTNPNESMKRERSHEWTDPINSLEYAIGAHMKIFQVQLPIIMNDKSIGNLV